MTTILNEEPRPVVIGIYGIPGSGKTYLMNQLKKDIVDESVTFYEGSEVISKSVTGGLEAFKTLPEIEKAAWRRSAITSIRHESIKNGHAAVVTGHFMFWPEEDVYGESVCTEDDLDTYTHILYLDVPAEAVAQRCQDDSDRSRPLLSSTHLERWQQTEKDKLRDLCLQHSILFAIIPGDATVDRRIASLIRNFKTHDEEYNLKLVMETLDDTLAVSGNQLETMLVMDGDKTLAAQDTGKLFWEMISTSIPDNCVKPSLEELFSGPMGYSYMAFRQAALLYETMGNEEEYDRLCQQVADATSLHPEFVLLLKCVIESQHVGAMVVTCGLGCVWEKVLEREKLAGIITVLGAGRISDNFVVTAAVKKIVVDSLQRKHGLYVWAFGDSPLDLGMMQQADQAIVVVGDERTRSRSMDESLKGALEHDGFRARQTLLPWNVPPRLEPAKLPIVCLTETDMLESIFRRIRPRNAQIVMASNENCVRILATSMRDARNAGPQLREAHHRVGWYLAIDYLSNVIGTEEYDIPHVQGNSTRGHRFLHEHQTTIVALMRGGEPMAFGVSEALPQAAFLHADKPGDISVDHLRAKVHIILVDAVINSGQTAVGFIKRIRALHATVRIFLLVGLVQDQSISKGQLAQALAADSQTTLLALRLSENKFTGKGKTDTGNRLFNTTHLA